MSRWRTTWLLIHSLPSSDEDKRDCTRNAFQAGEYIHRIITLATICMQSYVP